MAAITIEEALKRFDRRFYSYHVNQDKLSIFSENVKRYVDMTIKAIHENESEEHLKNITKLYIQTGKVKDVLKQIHANPKVEICAFKNGEWLRVAGELVEDDRREARQSMLDAYPSLQNMYSADDGNTEVFYFKNATATFSSFTHEPEVVKF